ncbi:MAG: hypothetical protein ABFC81_06615 [Rectinema sp.]
MSAGAGLGLLGVNALLGVPVVGGILSVGLVVLGAIGLFGKSRTDKVSGTILTAAGGLGIASIFMRGFTGNILSLGGLGLFVYGLMNIGGFVSGLRKKSK